MLKHTNLVLTWMSFIAAGVSTSLTDPSSGGQHGLSTASLSSASTDDVGESTSQVTDPSSGGKHGLSTAAQSSASTDDVEESTSQVSWDSWLDVPLRTTDLSINTESRADSGSNTEQIRPTPSSGYIKGMDTSLQTSGLRSDKEGIDSLTEGDTSTYSEMEMLPSSLTEYTVNEVGEDGQTYIDGNVFWSNPNDVSYITSVDSVSASMASYVDISVSYLVVEDSVRNALEETAIFGFDNGDIDSSAFEFVDSFSSFQDDYSSQSDVIEWKVNTLLEFFGSDVVTSAYKSVDSFSIRSTNQRPSSDFSVLEVATLPVFDDESNDFFSTGTRHKHSHSYVSATIGYGNYVSLSDSQSDPVSLSDSQSDPVSLSDSQSHTVSLSDSQSDPVSLSDSQSHTVSLSDSQSDLASLSYSQSESNSTSGNATSTLGNTTSAVNSTTPSSVTETRMCRCDCHYAANLKLYRNATAVNITSDEVQKELKKQVTSLQKELTLNKTNLSSAKRKKTSMVDDRASARGVGLIGVAMLVILMGGLVLMDLTTIKRDFQRLRDNLGHCCKESKSAC